MASVFLIKTDSGVTYELSATTSAEVTRSSTIAKNRVEDKSVVADNSVRDNAEVVFNGIISSIRRLDQLGTANSSNPLSQAGNNYKTYREYLEGINEVMDRSEFVTFFLDNDLTPIPDCSITRFSYIKDRSGGLTSWKVSLRGEQLRLSSRAVVGTIPNPSAGVSSVVEGSSGGGDGTATVTQTPLNTTIVQDFFGGTGAVSGPVDGFTGG